MNTFLIELSIDEDKKSIIVDTDAATPQGLWVYIERQNDKFRYLQEAITNLKYVYPDSNEILRELEKRTNDMRIGGIHINVICNNLISISTFSPTRDTVSVHNNF